MYRLHLLREMRQRLTVGEKQPVVDAKSITKVSLDKVFEFLMRQRLVDDVSVAN